MMAYYWANFKEIDGNLFRFDTRIYLNNITEPQVGDKCIGAVVGKNPGSAISRESTVIDALVEIELAGDKLLPNVRSIILKSFPEIKRSQYVQVLNLFYLCEKNISIFT